jgi:hypothetical protein
MRLNARAASSAASALASSRVALLLAGVLVLSESVVLATTLFVGAGVSIVASLLIAMQIYRVRAPRQAEAGGGPPTRDAENPAAAGSSSGSGESSRGEHLIRRFARSPTSSLHSRLTLATSRRGNAPPTARSKSQRPSGRTSWSPTRPRRPWSLPSEPLQRI